jgi:hypothetical protein
MASASVKLSGRYRKQLGVDMPIVPAALVTWIAKDRRAPIDGGLLLLHAIGMARQAAAIQATAVIVVDAFDAETEAMWCKRFEFKRSQQREPRVRLWLRL